MPFVILSDQRRAAAFSFKEFSITWESAEWPQKNARNAKKTGTVFFLSPRRRSGESTEERGGSQDWRPTPLLFQTLSSRPLVERECLGDAPPLCVLCVLSRLNRLSASVSSAPAVVKIVSTFRERFGGRAPLCEWMNMKTMPTVLSRAAL